MAAFYPMGRGSHRCANDTYDTIYFWKYAPRFLDSVISVILLSFSYKVYCVFFV
jgi:hypothetical protein